METKVKKSAAQLLRRKPPSPETLRHMAVLRLMEKLEGDSLSAADLLRVIAMQAADEGAAGPPPGDWVLAVQEEG